MIIVQKSFFPVAMATSNIQSGFSCQYLRTNAHIFKKLNKHVILHNCTIYRTFNTYLTSNYRQMLFPAMYGHKIPFKIYVNTESKADDILRLAFWSIYLQRKGYSKQPWKRAEESNWLFLFLKEIYSRMQINSFLKKEYTRTLHYPSMELKAYFSLVSYIYLDNLWWYFIIKFELPILC